MSMQRDQWSACFSFDDFSRILCDDISCCATCSNIPGYSRVFVACESILVMPPLYDDLSWKMVIFLCVHIILLCLHVCVCDNYASMCVCICNCAEVS